MTALSERQLVSLLGQRFQTRSPGVRVGIGDDAAVLEPQPEPWVCSVDSSVEGVHFDLAFLTFEDVGYRAFQAAISDLAAMGAAPVAALSALILPRGLSSAAIGALASGQALASSETECPVVGGNISRGKELSVTTTVLGCGATPLCRGGAQPGEQLWLVGSLGLAAAGLAALRLGRVRVTAGREERHIDGAEPSATSTAALARCVEAWRRPRALLSEGRALVGRASAAIDVSDGLAADAWQLARASRARIVVDRERLRAALDPSLIAASRSLRRSPLHFAVYGGEDYALLATGRASARPAWARAIGYVTRGTGAFLGLGRGLVPLRRGYDHLA